MIILTDLSEVLIRGIYGTEQHINKEFGEAMAVQWLKRRDETEDAFLDLLRGKMKETDYWQIFFEKYEWDFGIEKMMEMFSFNLRFSISGTRRLYESIHAYPLTTNDSTLIKIGKPHFVLTSDHISERIEGLRSCHPITFHLFTDEFWSCNIGRVKIDEGFFEYVLNELRVEPEEAIFIDDQPANCESARRANIKAIQFYNSRLLKKDLQSYGFMFGKRGSLID